MESFNRETGKKRKTRGAEGSERPNPEQDVEMKEEQVPIEQRKIIKPKKRVQYDDKIVDEEGNEIEFEGEVIEDVPEGDVVQHDSDDDEDDDNWEDAEDEAAQKKQIWDEKKAPLEEGEELVFDNSAYQMLHRSKVEWPCLSIDVLLRDRIGSSTPAYNSWFPQYVNKLDPKHTIKDKSGIDTHKHDKFPYTVYFCAGSQSTKKNENKIYVLKWSDMQQTLRDDDEEVSDEEEEEVKDPVMRFEAVPHRGCVNRIRSMHGTGIVATWNDENEVGIYNITSAVETLDEPVVSKQKKNFGGSKLASFKHTDEGYALDWSPLTLGRLAAGCCNSQIWLYQAADENCSQFVKETSVGL